jgi:hypothetical protein
MATSYQRRPDGKAPDARALLKQDPNLAAELQKVEERKKVLEQRGEENSVDAELAARLQPSMGNAAIAGMLNRNTDTVSAQGGEAALEEQKKKDEEQEEEGEEKEAGEVEHVLPSFSTGGGGGGSGQPPWAMSHMFGGDDDAAGEVIEVSAQAWRPMPILPDPDEDPELEDVDEDAPPDPDGVDLRGANQALGDAPWRPTILARGLRHARNVARRSFGPESLVDADGLDHALGRARSMLRFIARHGDGLDAVMLARAAASAGEAAFPTAGGFAGATARSLAMAETALVLLPSGWPVVLEVRAEPRARPRVENAARAVAEGGGLSAKALFEAVLGARIVASDVTLGLSAHPAAIEALTLAARLDPLPLIDVWERSERPATDDPGGLDAVFAHFLGEDSRGAGVQAEDLSSLFEAMNQLLGAIGGALVEIASAGVAIAPHVPAPDIVGVLEPTEAALRRAARRLYATGEQLEKTLGTEEYEHVRTLSLEAISVRSTVDVARQGAVASLASLLFDTPPTPPELPELYRRAEREAQAGRSSSAAQLLDAAVLSAPPEIEGRIRLGAAGLRLALGLPEEGQLAEAAGALGAGPIGAAARSLAAGFALARGSWAEAEAHGAAGAAIGRTLGLPYVIADAACTSASARFQRGAEWREPLLYAATLLRERDEGGALNLLKARWGELSS